MRDIVERLKETAIMLPRSGYVSVGHEAKEAADEITALRARAERAEAALATARRDALEEAAQTVLAEAYHLYNDKPRVPAALMEAADAVRALKDTLPPPSDAVDKA